MEISHGPSATSMAAMFKSGSSRSRRNLLKSMRGRRRESESTPKLALWWKVIYCRPIQESNGGGEGLGLFNPLRPL